MLEESKDNVMEDTSRPMFHENIDTESDDSEEDFEISVKSHVALTISLAISAFFFIESMLMLFLAKMPLIYIYIFPILFLISCKILLYNWMKRHNK